MSIQTFFPTYTLPLVSKLAAPASTAPPVYPGTNVPDMGCRCEGMGSYVQDDGAYYRNPRPYLTSDIGAPVPGWGVNPQVAGPRMIGVGATEREKLIDVTRKLRQMQQQSGDVANSGTVSQQDSAGELPWWALPVGAAVVMGGIGFYGYKKGWF